MAKKAKARPADVLDDRHLKELRDESGISDELIAARGYRTIDDPSELSKLGFSRRIAEVVVPGYLVPLRDASGEVLGHQFKPDDPRDDSKRPGRKVKYETPRGARNVVDCLPGGGRVGDADLLIVEGVKKADAARARGLRCVALTGVDNWRGRRSDGSKGPCEEWDSLDIRGQRVAIAYDSDPSRKTNEDVKRARQALTSFLTKQRGAAAVYWVDLPSGRDAAGNDLKTGLDDFFVRDQRSPHDLAALLYEPTPDQTADKPTQASRVIDYMEANYDLYLTPEKAPFVVPRQGFQRAIPFPPTGGELKGEVGLDIFNATGVVVGDTNLSAGLKIVYAKARRLPTTTPLHLRCCSMPDRVIIDLAQPGNTRCVVIQNGRWTVADSPPEGVFFRRTSKTLPLPDPVRARGRGWKALAGILGWRKNSRYFRLARGWLVAAPLEWIPRPVLNLIGPPGSAKSDRGLAVVSVLDPRSKLGSSFGKNLDDDRVKALGSFLVGYDNLSSVSEAQSDHLCRLVSGEGSEKRQLYADTDVISMDYSRTGVFTSITVLQWRPDALERLIQLPLNRIDDFKSQTAIRQEFEQAHPLILGDLCDDIATMLSRLPAMLADRPTDPPRMVDYWLALRALGDEFADAFQTSGQEAMVDAAENDPWVVAVRDWLQDTNDHKFIGSPTAGYSAFADWLISHRLAGSELGSHIWPRSHKSMSELLDRSAVPLKAVGVTFRKSRSNGQRKWRLKWSG